MSLGSKRDSFLRNPTRLQEVSAKKRRRPGPLGMTGVRERK